MAGLALPKFRWLLAGALAAGVWVVREDMRTPRPPERVPPSKSVLNLPKTVGRPPLRPQNIVTGSIEKPVGMRLLRTTTKVRIRAQAQATAPVVAMLEAGQTVRELARSGKWRLVQAEGRKGWVHADYLAQPLAAPRRPKLPVLGKPPQKQASVTIGAKPAPKKP